MDFICLFVCFLFIFSLTGSLAETAEVAGTDDVQPKGAVERRCAHNIHHGALVNVKAMVEVQHLSSKENLFMKKEEKGEESGKKDLPSLSRLHRRRSW